MVGLNIEEEWRQHPLYKDYWISSLGNVWVDYKVGPSGRRMQPHMCKNIIIRRKSNGYAHVRVNINNKMKTVSHLVVEAFSGLILPEDSEIQVHHIDEDSTNNSVLNLDVVMRADHNENNPSWLAKRKNSGVTHKSVVIDGIEYETQSEAARALNIRRGTLIAAVKNNKTSFNSRGVHHTILYKKENKE